MKGRGRQIFAVVLATAGMFGNGVFAGTFKHITIDGSFDDWSGVPLAYTQAQDVTGVVAYQNVYVANDDNYLYLRLSLHDSANPFTSQENIFVDADDRVATRFDAHGRPRLSFLRRGSGNNGAINSHCSSVTSFCRFFMTEAQPFNRLKRKYLI